MNIKIIKEGAVLYHLYIKDKDIWLSRMDMIELRHYINEERL